MPVEIKQGPNRREAGGTKPIELTPEQKAKLESEFVKAITDTLGTIKPEWTQSGFSKDST